MADETIEIDVNVNDQGAAEKFTRLQTQIKQTRIEMQRAQEAGDSLTFNRLKGQLDDLEDKLEVTQLKSKQFDMLNKQIQEEIFVAHNVTSPMLFGIRTEGQLGGRKELSEVRRTSTTSISRSGTGASSSRRLALPRRRPPRLGCSTLLTIR